MYMRIPTLAALALTIGIALAQEPDRHGPPTEAERVERLAVLLDLNEGQKVEVAKVLSAERQKMLEFRQQVQQSNQRPTPEQIRSQRQQIQADTIESLRPILTDQQLQKFEALGPMTMGHPPRRR